PRTPAPPTLPSFPTRRSSDLLPAVRDAHRAVVVRTQVRHAGERAKVLPVLGGAVPMLLPGDLLLHPVGEVREVLEVEHDAAHIGDRKSTRLNSSHDQISYAVF